MRAIRKLEVTRPWVAAFIFSMMAGFSVPPLLHVAQESDNMDYNLWQSTGQKMWEGAAIYPAGGERFPFMYPPPCAALLASISPLPEFGFVLVLVTLNSLAWAACILLSVHLATGRCRGAPPALYFWPSVAVIPLVYNTYLLGQPALVLLALVLGCFALVRRGNGFVGGALLAAAVAIKAYPIIAAGYLVYRRQWRALAGLLCGLVAAFCLLPLAFHSPAQLREETVVWARGMLFKADEQGIAQRPERSLGYKNQSLQATVHRLLRPVLADGESDKTWKVNFGNLSFAQANAVSAAAMIALLGIYAWATFGRAATRPSGEALEMGMAAMLAVLLAPLSFQYSYVWLLFPLTTLLHLAIANSRGSKLGRRATAVIAACVFLLLWSVPFTRTAAAYGNIFLAGLAVYLGSAIILRTCYPRRAG